MAKSKVQFQEGLSDLEFMERYGNEEKCILELTNSRWPNGFVCPECGETEHCFLNNRKLYQCNSCHKQTSLISGTIFQGTKLPLIKWFIAMNHITANKHGISSMELSRKMGVSVNTALIVKSKLQQVMLERNSGETLEGRIEIDDAYMGGENPGGKRGRGSENKVPFVAAVATTQEREPDRMKMNVVPGFRKQSIQKWAKAQLSSGSEVVSDGLACFAGVEKAGCEHYAVIVGKGNKSTELQCFNWVNTTLGNIKTSIAGTYHAVSKKHIPRYLAEFEYRFNRRYNLKDILPRLLRVCTYTPPMPQRLLKLAEASW